VTTGYLEGRARGKLFKFERNLFEAHSKAAQRTWSRVKKSTLESPVNGDEVKSTLE